MHFQYIAGDTFELDVHDGNNINASKLLHVTQWTGVNQAVTPLSSSGHELYIRFRYSTSRSSTGASIDFLIMDDRGKSNICVSLF